MERKTCVKVVFLAAAVLMLSGCATIIARNLKGYNEDWEINFVEMKDGPNSVNQTVVFTVHPNQGYRFIWVTIEAKNRSDEPKTINLKMISLVSGEVQSFPFNLITDNMEQKPSYYKLTVAPHQSERRQIVFSFPTNLKPRTIRIPDFNDIPVE